MRGGRGRHAAQRGALRFSPHTLVLVLAFAGVFVAMQGAVVGFVFWWWAPTYRAVDLVMEDWHPNDGKPTIEGKLADSGEAVGLPGAERDGRRVLLEVPSVAFAEGARVPVWHSPEAPTFSYAGAWTNTVPVAALPVRPGLGRILASLGVALLVVVAAVFAAAWLRRRAGQATGIASIP